MKKVILLMLTAVCFISLHAQSVYEFSYNQIIDGERTPVKSIFFQNANNSGFLRTRYTDAISKENILLQMDLEEEEVINELGKIDTTTLFVKTTNVVSMGLGKNKGALPIFLFKLNNNNGFLEPKELFFENDQKVKMQDSEALFTATYLPADSVTKEFFSTYFYEDDSFMIQYFRFNSKDITPAEKKMKMYMLVVADTVVKDIGASCALDVKRMTESFAYIATYIGCELIIKPVMGKNYKKANVLSELKLLNPGRNDIVIFYYTGHGFRNPNDKRRYPNLDLRTNIKQDHLKESLNMEDVFEIIKKKPARLNLVLSDCCNSFVNYVQPVTLKPFQKKSLLPLLYMDNVRRLFLDPNKLSILSTAADSTQIAASNNQFGGFYSYFLKLSMEDNCTKAHIKPTWHKILEETKNQTYIMSRKTTCSERGKPDVRCNQIPCFRIK